jgi:hypothetical protein
MPELFGIRYRRTELLRRIGRLEQVAGVRPVTIGDGKGRGVRVLEFRTGTGFAFDVLVDRCFDVGRCEFAGQPLSWLSAPGVVAPWYYEPDGWGWFRAWGGGMVVTCGLDHTLGPDEDTAAHFNQPHLWQTIPYGLHGRVGGLPARLAGGWPRHRQSTMPHPTATVPPWVSRSAMRPSGCSRGAITRSWLR